MTCHAIYWQLELKAKTSVAQTDSQACVYAKGLICMDISVLQSSSFEITSGQWIFKIFRKQRFTNVCNFEIVVLATFHGFEFDLKTLVLLSCYVNVIKKIFFYSLRKQSL
jgi:hypothetical protein